MASARHPFVESEHPIAFAHRGGARENSENSLTAFQRAADLGFNYFETDVRATADGVVMAFHDASLNRVTDRVGRISALPYDEVRRAKIAGRDHILRLEELLAAFPEAKFNIDIKDDHTLEPFAELIERMDVRDRICVASFSGLRLRSIRRRWPDAATSLAPAEVAGLLAVSRLGPLAGLASQVVPRQAVAIQVPPSARGIPIISSALISAAHERGLAVHAWTIDNHSQMHRLLDMGVDGLITDRPTTLRRVLIERGQWNGSS